jgi:CDGSH-type Zn-finger protein
MVLPSLQPKKFWLTSGAVGADGNVISDKETFSLCRCGHSKDKPFCDGAHREAGFEDPGTHAPVE